jgi:hypothetical protein
VAVVTRILSVKIAADGGAAYSCSRPTVDTEPVAGLSRQFSVRVPSAKIKHVGDARGWQNGKKH